MIILKKYQKKLLMDIEGNKIDLKPIPKFNKMKRIQARKSWLVMLDFIR